MQQKLRRELSKLFQIYIPVAINGTVEAESRQKIVDEFNSAPGFQILILSPEAAGVGLNITGANNVIHLSRSWNPAKEDQATDRVYRIGQKKDVNVYIPIAYDSALGEGECFDEKLDKLLDFKRSLSDVALFPSVETQKDQEYLLGCVFNHEDGPQVFPRRNHGIWMNWIELMKRRLRVYRQNFCGILDMMSALLIGEVWI